MNERILEITDMDAYLSVERGFLKITVNKEKEYKVPLCDIGGVIANSYRLTYSNNAIVKLAELNIPLVVCGSNHSPVGILWSVEPHSLTSGRIDSQINATRPKYNNIWKQIVRTKIHNQGVCLKALGKKHIKVTSLIAGVLSGDKTNQEGHAARTYWQELFGKKFIRNRDGDGINAMLNYGYTILRSGISRAIMGAGLHPSIGIFHKNKFNAMRLADDLMEPFRPITDYFVYLLSHKGVSYLTPEAKKTLVDILYIDMDSPKGRSPVINRMQSLATSFALSLERLKINLDLPILTAGDLKDVNKE